GKERAQRQESQDDQLARHIAWPEQSPKLRVQRLHHLGGQPAVLPTLCLEYGTSQGGYSLTEFNIGRFKRMVLRPLQGEDADDTFTLRQGYRTHRARPVLTHEFFVGTRDPKGGSRRGWVHDGSGLVQGLVHSGFQGTR